MDSKKMLIGLNVFEGDIPGDSPRFALTAGDGETADYVVCHFDPQRNTLEDNLNRAKLIAARFRELGLDFIANFEYQNFCYDCTAPDGVDWADNSGGLHILKLPPEYIEALQSAGNLTGIEYDELEHCIINRNISISLASKFHINPPVFELTKTDNVYEQEAKLDGQLAAFAQGYKDMGVHSLYGEHVFPVLFHMFARNGITPNFKSQKESASNLQFAVAGGAALQYGTPLSNCVDMWYQMTNPGHSPEEMKHNLIFAYLAGVNRVYVESSSPMVTDDRLNEYGRAYKEFCREYRGKERDYDISDFTPEIGIIRQDDSYWGQWDPVMWKNMLYGNKKIKPDRASKEYITVFNIITHGESFKKSVSWDRTGPLLLKKHRSFISMNSTAVFDDRVCGSCLDSLKLCFLCGRHISKETAAKIDELVNGGLIAVTTKKHLPEALKSKANGGYTEIPCGKGAYIAVNSFADRRLRKRIEPFTGKKGQIRLTFGCREIILNISENGETFTQEA